MKSTIPTTAEPIDDAVRLGIFVSIRTPGEEEDERIDLLVPEARSLLTQLAGLFGADLRDPEP